MSSLTTNYLGACCKTPLAFLMLLIGAVAAAESMTPADVEAEALAADDTCAAGSTGCSLNALQRKGRSFLNVGAKLRQPAQSMRMHRHRRWRRRETGGHNDGRLEGAAFADYSVDVTIGDRTFQVIVDTGSSEFAVAASAGDGCWEYYRGPCSHHRLSAHYGSGSWEGLECGGPEVRLAGLSAGAPSFAGITEERHFLTQCSRPTGIVNEGIVGMAYQGLIHGMDAVPLFDSVVETTGVPNVFGMQCCGWHGGEAAGGQLTLGGVDSGLYRGEFQFTPVTRELYFCVDLEDIHVEGHHRPPEWDMSMRELGASNRSARDSKQESAGKQESAYMRDCSAIIDSGCSEIILTSDHYYRVMHVLEPLSDQISQNAPCVFESMLESFPSVTIRLAGDVVLSVPPTTYFQPDPDGSGCFQLFFGRTHDDSSTIGQPLMEAYYTVFDKENGRVGFAPIAGCD